MTNKHGIAQTHFEKYDTFEDMNEDDPTWLGNIDNCDICSRPMEDEDYMIDGPTDSSNYPKWGNLCVVCAFKHILIIEWGKAQLYKQKNLKWYLIAGGPTKNEMN